MAYTDPWNETTPAGSVDASTLDTVIQNEVKRGIRERLEQVIPTWGDDAVDPKRVKFHTGTSYPTAPVAGEPFFNTDDLTVEVFDGSEWLFVSGIITGTVANRPAANTVGEGAFFWATDEAILYIQIADAWAIATSTGGTVIRGDAADRPDAGDVALGTFFWAEDTDELSLVEEDSGSPAWVSVNKQRAISVETIHLEQQGLATSPDTPVETTASTLHTPHENIILSARFRFRNFSGPSSWSDWIYQGVSVPNASNSAFSFPGEDEVFPMHFTYRVEGTVDAAPTFSIIFKNNTGVPLEIDVQIQYRLMSLTSDEFFDEDPTFSP